MEHSIEKQLEDLLARKEEIGEEISSLGGWEQETAAVRALRDENTRCIKAIRLLRQGPPKPPIVKAA